MPYKVYRVKDVDETVLNDSVLEHCNYYSDLNMRKISKFAYAKMLELVKETFNQDLSSEEIIFEGKPHFKESKIKFNISHEDNLVAVIVSERECGIDLTRKVTKLELANKILSFDEKQEFDKAEDKEEYIAQKWAMKEAYSKMTGTGLNEALFSRTINVPIKEVTDETIDKKYYLCYMVESK